jgi:hypothetical protein
MDELPAWGSGWEWAMRATKKVSTD